MTLHCPSCGKSFDKQVFPLGSRVACPFCMSEFDIAQKETIKIPGEAKPEVAAAAAAAQAPAPKREVEDEAPTEAKPAKEEREVGPGDRLGGFRLDREIGRGGMGVVYLGVQESLNRPVA